MVKFEITDSALQLVSGLGGLAYGAHALIAPRHWEETHFGPRLTPRPTDEMIRYNGHAVAAIGALTLAARNELTPAGKRNWFRTSGAMYATAAALTSNNAYRGKQRKAVAYANTAVLTGLAAVNLWRGFNSRDSKVSL